MNTNDSKNLSKKFSKNNFIDSIKYKNKYLKFGCFGFSASLTLYLSIILSLVGYANFCPALDIGWDSGGGAPPHEAMHSASASACPQFYVQATEPKVLNPKLAQNIRLLCFSNFAVGYSPVSRTPLWSAEHLTRDLLYRAKGLKRVNAFHEEDRLPSSERAYLSDYARSGYDRGHMSPSADQPSEQAQQDSFSLANMVPQNPNNNRHLWEGIESATRTWTKSAGDLFIITGPLFIGSSLEQLHGRVMVPTHLFKIIYDPATGGASAYLVKNIETDEYAVISLDELSKVAGIDFIPVLNATQKHTKINLPAPTPHNTRSDLRSDQTPPSQSTQRAHDYESTQSESGAEFRQVEHLLREITHLIN